MTSFKHLVAGLMVSTALVSVPLVASAQSEEKKVLAAIVDGKEIHQDEVRAMMDLVPPQYKQAPFEVLYPMLLQAVVNRHVIANKARADKLDESDEYKIRMSRFEEQLLQTLYLDQKVEAAMTEDRVKEAYESFKKSFPVEDEVRARHILLETEEAAKAVIEAIKGGKDFAELAKEKSIGPSKDRGGDLGFFGKGAMVPDFEQAAFALEVGGFSQEPVKTQFGFHVIKLEEKRKKQPPKLEEVEESLREQLAQTIGGEIMEDLIKGISVKKFDMQGKEVVEIPEKKSDDKPQENTEDKPKAE